MAGVELIVGIVAAVVGLRYFLAGCTSDNADAAANRYCVAGGLALVIGSVIAVTGFIQLLVQLRVIHGVFS